MAYRIEKRSPLDISARKAVGVKLPFNTVFVSTYQTIDAYRANLINYLLTDKGERYLNPDFGSNLKSLLFEPDFNDTQKEIIKYNLIQEISVYFPKLVVDLIDIVTVAEHTVQVYLKFHIKDSRLSNELVVNFE